MPLFGFQKFSVSSLHVEVKVISTRLEQAWGEFDGGFGESIRGLLDSMDYLIVQSKRERKIA